MFSMALAQSSMTFTSWISSSQYDASSIYVVCCLENCFRNPASNLIKWYKCISLVFIYDFGRRFFFNGGQLLKCFSHLLRVLCRKSWKFLCQFFIGFICNDFYLAISDAVKISFTSFSPIFLNFTTSDGWLSR